MALRMACERADLFAAVVSHAGAAFENPASCTPSEPVSVLHIHGTEDMTILFDGGQSEHSDGALVGLPGCARNRGPVGESQRLRGDDHRGHADRPRRIDRR